MSVIVNLMSGIKITLGLLVILLILYVIFSGVLGPPSIFFFVSVLIIIIATIVYLGYKYGPIRRLVVTPRDHTDFIYEEAKRAAKGSVEFPAEIDGDGTLIKKPNYDISFIIGDHHYLRYKDDKNIIHNIFYDDANKSFRGEIKGDWLDIRPKKAVEQATGIIEMAKAGALPRMISPLGVPEIQRILQLPTKVEEEGKKEEEKKKPI